MNYYIDTEFIEGFHKPLFGKRRHHIDLISIGIVAEDGRSYYAISNEYKYDDADSWVKEHVIIPMYQKEISGDRRNHLDASNFHKAVGKSNKKIAEEVEWFIRSCHHVNCRTKELVDDVTHKSVDFYGYYADYDWVLFCSLFGRMIDLPAGFPMHCIDLKQTLDEKAGNQNEGWLSPPTDDQRLEYIKSMVAYPKQTNEHNALADAYWNRELHKFLIAL